MALITEDLRIPDVGVLFPTTRRWRKVRPCGTGAAYRRHFRRKDHLKPGWKMDDKCREWHAKDERERSARVTALAVLEPRATSGDQSVLGPLRYTGYQTLEQHASADLPFELDPWSILEQRTASHEVPGQCPETAMGMELEGPASASLPWYVPEDCDVTALPADTANAIS